MPTIEELQSLSPTAFEQVVKKVFDGLGYKATVTGRSGDEGVDLVLEKGDERSIAQCKRYKGQVGQSVIREFYGTVVHEKAERGYLVTTGTFSLPAQTWAQGKNLILVDGTDLVKGMDTLNLRVAIPAAAGREPDELARLGQALRAARDSKAYLRVAILGPPPKLDGYGQAGMAVADVLGNRRGSMSGTFTRAQTDAVMVSLRKGDFLLVDELGANLDAAGSFIDIVHSPAEQLRWGRRVLIDEVHLLCTVWEPRKLERLPLRQRMMFDEAFPLQIEADLIDWSDIEGWARRLVNKPPTMEDEPS